VKVSYNPAVDELMLATRYEERDLVRGFGIGARWDRKARAWRAPYSIMAMEILREAAENGRGVEFVGEIPWPSAPPPVPGLNPSAGLLRHLLHHQKETVTFAVSRRRAAIFDDMGTGKTASAIAFCREVGVRRVLVLCPLSVMSSWAREILALVPEDERGVFPIMGSGFIKGDLLSRALTCSMRRVWAIVNYDSVWRLPGLDDARWDAVVADESSRIKDRSSKCHKKAVEIADKAAYVVALNGTPVSNGVEDLWAQFRFVDRRVFGESWPAFRARYLVMGGFQGKQIIGTQRQDELRKVVRCASVRHLKDECLDLPERVYQRRYAMLRGSQYGAYKDVEREFVAWVRAVREADGTEADYKVRVQNALGRLLRCQQVASGHVVGADGALLRFDPAAKTDALRELLEDMPERRGVVFCRFIEDIEIVNSVLDSMGLPHREISGRVPEPERAAAQAALKDGTTDFVVAQVNTGGYGIDLTGVSTAIFWNNWWSWSTRDQAESRIHRWGQKRRCVFVDLLAERTVDELVLDAVLQKRHISEVLFGKEVACAEPAFP
jgi:SNF2 family DNA or RNA helicase